MRYWIARTQYRGPVDTNQSLALICVRLEHEFRGDLFDRALIWNQALLHQALREYERQYAEHPARRSLAGAPSLQDRHQPNSSSQTDVIFSDEASTSITMRHELHGRSSRHAQVRQRIQQRLDALPVQSAREAKRLLTVWQFYLRILAGIGSATTGTDQVLQARAVVLLAELVVRWPALSAHLFGVVDGEQGVTLLRGAAKGDDVEWAQAAAKVGLDPNRDRNAAKALRELLGQNDSYLLAALVRRLL